MYWYEQCHNLRSTHSSQKKIRTLSPGSSIYETSSNNGIESESEFFLAPKREHFQKPNPSKTLKF